VGHFDCETLRYQGIVWLFPVFLGSLFRKIATDRPDDRPNTK